MIGLEVLFRGNVYKASSNERSLSLSCSLYNNIVSLYFSAYNLKSQSIERWLISTLDFEEEVIVLIKEIESDSSLLDEIPHETPEEKSERKNKAIADFRQLEEYLIANHKL